MKNYIEKGHSRNRIFKKLVKKEKKKGARPGICLIINFSIKQAAFNEICF